MNKLQQAQQLRRAVQLFALSLNEETALEMPGLYPAYQVGRDYQAGAYLRYGRNALGDPQLYRVVQDHISQADWPPDATPALYAPMGLAEDGTVLWSRPSGVHDAYGIGDVVEYRGVRYRSTVEGNVWPPDRFPAGWEEVDKQ